MAQPQATGQQQTERTNGAQPVNGMQFGIDVKPGMIDVVPDEEARLIVRNVHAYYGEAHAVKDITFAMRSRKVTAIIGPSGCGKSTLLRCMNRMHEEQRAARVEGQIILDGENIYDRSVDPVLVRRRIGMVFQKPNPFPTMSIADNVLAGYKLNRVRAGKGDLAERCEVALRRAALWDEVKDQLNRPGTDLSGGQQQRLCIARSLAVDPEILLMDEPCSALDPLATARIEDLVKELSQEITVVIVTHNMQQAARVSDMTAFMLLGRMIEYGPTTDMFTTPRDERTEAYITGRFG